MRARDVRFEASGGRARLHARIDPAAGEGFALWVDLPAAAAASSAPGNALACALLPSAMERREPLEIDAPVCPRLSRTLAAAQRFLLRSRRSHRAALRRVDVSAPAAAPPPAGPGEGLFFSGGLDSSFSAVRHRTRLSHLVLVEGFDVPLAEHDARSEVRRRAEEAARALGPSLVVVSTNLRDTPLGALDWEIAFGAALAGVAHLLQGLVRRMRVAASYSRGTSPRFWGSHPELDALWSSASLEIEHDSFRVPRILKAKLVGRTPAVRDVLRVCWQPGAGGRNCSRCEKCLRTMVQLEAWGALSDCAAFEPLDTGRIESSRIPRHLRFSWRTAREVLKRRRGSESLIAAIDAALSRKGPAA